MSQLFTSCSICSLIAPHANNPLLEFLPEFTEDDALFEALDVNLALGLGVEFPLSDAIRLVVEARGTYGLKDINDRDWRFPDIRNNYNSSRNFFSGFKVGVMATVW